MKKKNCNKKQKIIGIVCCLIILCVVTVFYLIKTTKYSDIKYSEKDIKISENNISTSSEKEDYLDNRDEIKHRKEEIDSKSESLQKEEKYDGENDDGNIKERESDDGISIGDSGKNIVEKENSQEIVTPEEDSLPHNPPPVEQVVMSEQVSQVIALINEGRINNGLSELVVNNSLNNSAMIRAKELETVYSHTRPNGQGPNTALGIAVKSFGENIAHGYYTPSLVVSGWMASPQHRAGILNPEYNTTGVGVVKGSDGVIYWVQHFAKL